MSTEDPLQANESTEITHDQNSMISAVPQAIGAETTEMNDLQSNIANLQLASDTSQPQQQPQPQLTNEIQPNSAVETQLTTTTEQQLSQHNDAALMKQRRSPSNSLSNSPIVQHISSVPLDPSVAAGVATAEQMARENHHYLPAPFMQPVNTYQDLNPDSNIYVANLPNNFTSELLRKLFEAFGQIARLKFVRQDDPHQPGFGFVQFADVNDSKRAIQELQNHLFDNGEKLYLSVALRRRSTLSEEPTNLYVKNIPNDWGDKDILTQFRKYGKILQLKLNEDGIAFVRFETHSQALMAIDGMHDQPVTGANGEDLRIEVRFANRKTAATAYREGKTQHKQNEHNLYIRNLPHTFTQANLEEIFGSYGKISSAKVADNGVAFVRFVEAVDAQKSIRALNGKCLHESSGEALVVKLAYFDIGDSRNRTWKTGHGFGGGGSEQGANGGGQRGAPRGAFHQHGGQHMNHHGVTGHGQRLDHMQHQNRPPHQFQQGMGGVTSPNGMPGGVAAGGQGFGVNLMSPGMGLSGPNPQGYMGQMHSNPNQPMHFPPFQTSNTPMLSQPNAGLMPSVPTALSPVFGGPTTMSQQEAQLQAQIQHLQQQIQMQRLQQGGGMQAPSFQQPQMNMFGAPAAAQQQPPISAQPTTVNPMAIPAPNSQTLLPLSQHATDASDQSHHYTTTQQQMGDQLYKYIHNKYPDYASKITGMILHMGDDKAQHYLNHCEELDRQIDKAVKVLRSSKRFSKVKFGANASNSPPHIDQQQPGAAINNTTLPTVTDPAVSAESSISVNSAIPNTIQNGFNAFPPVQVQVPNNQIPAWLKQGGGSGTPGSTTSNPSIFSPTSFMQPTSSLTPGGMVSVTTSNPTASAPASAPATNLFSFAGASPGAPHQNGNGLVQNLGHSLLNVPQLGAFHSAGSGSPVSSGIPGFMPALSGMSSGGIVMGAGTPNNGVPNLQPHNSQPQSPQNNMFGNFANIGMTTNPFANPNQITTVNTKSDMLTSNNMVG